MPNTVKTTTTGGNTITTTINGKTTTAKSGFMNNLTVITNLYEVGSRSIETAYNSAESRKWRATDNKNPNKVCYSYFEKIAIIKLLLKR